MRERERERECVCEDRIPGRQWCEGEVVGEREAGDISKAGRVRIGSAMNMASYGQDKTYLLEPVPVDYGVCVAPGLDLAPACVTTTLSMPKLSSFASWSRDVHTRTVSGPALDSATVQPVTGDASSLNPL